MKKLFTALFICFAFVAFAQEQVPGREDLTFGTYGTFRFAPSESVNLIEKVLVQEDGKIITVGRSLTDGENYAIYVSRHNADGTLDETYGEGGISFFKANPTISNSAKDAVLSDDGLLYIAGYTYDYEGNTSFILCLDEDGFEYPGFGGEGWARTYKGGGIVYEAIDVDSEGNVVVVGHLNDQLLVRRYLPNGQLDTSFGNNGTVNDAVFNSIYSYGSDVKIIEDGKIVVAGRMLEEEYDVAYVCRFNTYGSLDTTFGYNGVVRLNVGEESESASGVEVDADGNYLVTGEASLPTENDNHFKSESYITRVTKDGLIDIRFGEGGDGFVRFGVFEGNIAFNRQYATPVVAPDGQIFGTFYSYNEYNSYNNNSSVYVYNLDENGKLKENFFGGGMSLIEPEVNYEVNYSEIISMSLALHADKLFVGGYIYYEDTEDNWDIFISKLYTDVKNNDDGNDTPEPEPIEAPENLVVTPVSTSSIILTWNVVENAESYNVYRDGDSIANVANPTYTDKDLEYNTEYCYIVTAVRGDEESEKSSAACATTMKADDDGSGDGSDDGNDDGNDNPTDTIVPEPEVLAIPENLVANALSTSSIILTWDIVENAESYNVYRDGEMITNVTNTNYTDKDLEYNTKYCYEITAVRDDEESEKSKMVCAKTLGESLEELSSSINIYPNPVENELFLATEVRVEEVSIYDIYGRQTMSQQVNETTSQQVVEVADLEAGVYFVNIKTENGNIVKRFVKK